MLSSVMVGDWSPVSDWATQVSSIFLFEKFYLVFNCHIIIVHIYGAQCDVSVHAYVQ